MIHLTWGGRHTDFVRHVVLDPDLLIGEEQTSTRHDFFNLQGKNMRSFEYTMHSVDGHALYSYTLPGQSIVKIGLYDPSGREVARSIENQSRGEQVHGILLPVQTGIFLMHTILTSTTVRS
ncbi:MAG: hypothetical protein GF350_09745 [Chitinivibrionales bacterium]|nr:hypothetical protein [Chitinivibrionales bacterium]